MAETQEQLCIAELVFLSLCAPSTLLALGLVMAVRAHVLSGCVMLEDIYIYLPGSSCIHLEAEAVV